MKKFKVGDRIKAVEGCAEFYSAGDLGGVVKVDPQGIWVEFDKYIGGHACYIAKRCASAEGGAA